MGSLIFRCLAAGALVLAAVPAFAEEKPRPRTVAVTVGQTVRLQMSSKRPIKTVFNDNETVLRVAPVPDDPTTVLLTGLAPGRARVTLIDIDGREESRDLGKPSGK
jgi:hypothetical protein